MTNDRCFCTSEDRPAAWVGVKLLALSLQRHCPGAALHIYTQGAPAGIQRWFETNKLAAQIRLFTPPIGSWDVKPIVLRHVLAGHEEAVWIDADALLAGDLTTALDRIPPERLVVAEDPWPAPRAAERCAFFNRPVRRQLPHAVNSCIIKVRRSAAHLAVLDCWEQLLADARYRQLQQRPVRDRPAYMIGDQDVLEAVLAGISESEAPDLGPAYLRCGQNHIAPIIPEALSIAERISLAFDRRRPAVVHAQGLAPWTAQHWSPGLLKHARWQLHPYTEIARSYRRSLTPAELAWADQQSWFSQACRWTTFCQPYLQGVPLILAGRLYARWFLRRRPTPLPAS